MAEIARLIAMLDASAAHHPSFNKQLNCGVAALSPVAEVHATPRIPSSLLEALQLVAQPNYLPPKPCGPQSADFNSALKQVISTIKSFSTTRVEKSPSDLKNDLAIATCKRIFAAASNPLELELIAQDLEVTTANMAARLPSLSTSDLPPPSATESSATASPARGSAMRASIFKSVRVPEFRFKWQFWAEKGQQSSAPSAKDKAAASAEDFAARPKPLGDQIISVKEFYQHFNNIPVENLKLRDSIHLFHLGVKPLWEDPRNSRGGAYYFRVTKEVAAQFWHEMCLLAVGDILQSAVETKRASFNDDICGLSYSVRWNAVQIAIWNRDADNEVGKEKLLVTILDKLSEELAPKKESYWYKAHREHKGFVEPGA
ncbi:translation initiation factor eIF 4e-like domain-containing protein [Massariosphaeria phaeospora]|uniref:Translation initiation factor eIF 4e-like domain-containing protein n=1 Tax=Massariosphaeria phaeospora TaxID=100035 RepID=A0A7C8MCK9_9PLEO|nr:translation initiation factor eIF 4e-like domain-containing protein [Massariosphaeria phaeospora]